MTDRPVLAICYDFDKTLSPDNMQAQGYLQAINYEDQAEFWAEAAALADSHGMDVTLAWMYLMLRKARGKEIFRRGMLMDYGLRVELYPGVREWFDRTRRYGEERGITVEHYIISSGLREMIEGTDVAGEFEQIYASSFFYDDDGIAVWPAQVVNFTSKTQFLFRISKGVPGINDDAVNDYFAPGELRVPFRNMVYIGDSETDIPCMKLVNSYGGHSIGVYDPSSADTARVRRMIRENRIRYFAPADYTEGSELDGLIRMIMDKTVADEALERVHQTDLCRRVIYLAGGCFWGLQKYLDQFDGVVRTEVGYANGPDKAPTYEEVCANSGHAETVLVEYDESVISLEKLLRLYFMVIDPLSVNRQGHDSGVQYRTGIYYDDPAQAAAARAVYDEEQDRAGQPLAVELGPLENFFAAEEYHQKYLDKNPGGYCHIPASYLNMRRDG